MQSCLLSVAKRPAQCGGLGCSSLTVGVVHGAGRGVMRAGTSTVKAVGRGTGSALRLVLRPFKGKKNGED